MKSSILSGNGPDTKIPLDSKMFLKSLVYRERPVSTFKPLLGFWGKSGQLVPN